MPLNLPTPTTVLSNGGGQAQVVPTVKPPPHLAIVIGSRVGKCPSLGFSQLELGESSVLSDGKAEKM